MCLLFKSFRLWHFVEEAQTDLEMLFSIYFWPWKRTHKSPNTYWVSCPGLLPLNPPYNQIVPTGTHSCPQAPFLTPPLPLRVWIISQKRAEIDWNYCMPQIQGYTLFFLYEEILWEQNYFISDSCVYQYEESMFMNLLLYANNFHISSI